MIIIFLSTLSLRRATQTKRLKKLKRLNFYPRSPCGERPFACWYIKEIIIFLSTLSLRRATTSLVVIGTNCIISIHALLAESDPETVPCGPHADISIHALLAESDGELNKLAGQKLVFLSTLSLRRATARRDSRQQPAGISIHALLAESDSQCRTFANGM